QGRDHAGDEERDEHDHGPQVGILQQLFHHSSTLPRRLRAPAARPSNHLAQPSRSPACAPACTSGYGSPSWAWKRGPMRATHRPAMPDVPDAALPSSAHWSPPPGITPVQRRMTMAGTLMALLLAALDQTIVATAGPAIQEDLQIPAGLYAWLTSSYLVASVATLPLFGKLSDRLGRKAILLAAIIIFVVDRKSTRLNSSH